MVEELREIYKQYFYFSQHGALNYQISSGNTREKN